MLIDQINMLYEISVLLCNICYPFSFFSPVAFQRLRNYKICVEGIITLISMTHEY